MKTYRITPHDLLFFRDGRPLDRNKQDQDHRNIGHGAFWPRPDHLYNAVMHALIGSRTAGERAAYGKFGGLRVTGPYPIRKNEDSSETLYLPRPLDWFCDLEEIPAGSTDAPAFVEAGFIDRKEGKKNLPAWISLDDLKQYLSGAEPETPSCPKKPLFETETRIGTTLDPATGASMRFHDQSRSGQYEAQYLRLGKNVSMWCAADPGKPDAEIPRTFVMGGQNGLVDCVPDDSLKSLEDLFPQPAVPPDSPEPLFLRWTLLVPALFVRTGWLPGWCRDTRKDVVEHAPDGTVMFPDCVGARLVAAFVGKPVVFSGFDTLEGIKDTQLAVPAGSCYVFRCETTTAAKELLKRLHLQRQSDFGPQGFGIGVCSFVDPPRPSAARSRSPEPEAS